MKKWKKTKVYCIGCYYLKGNEKKGFSCYYPGNVEMKDDNWYAIEKHPIKPPQEINSSNNCSWFKEMPSGFRY